MKLYSDGTVTVTGGSNTVDGGGTAFKANVEEGAFLSIKGFSKAYQVAKVVSDTQLLLSSKISDLSDGILASSLEYAIGDEFTPWNALACPTRHSIDPIAHINRSLAAIDKAIGE